MNPRPAPIAAAGMGTIMAMTDTQRGTSCTVPLPLLQLVSPALPVGAYAYSQALEYAVDAGWVTNEQQAADWIAGLMRHAQVHLDAPVLLRLHQAWQADDHERVMYWNQYLYASRETAELQAEDYTLARALIRLLIDLDIRHTSLLKEKKRLSYACPFALAAVQWQISAGDTIAGYLWSWAENQVAAAIKLVPLGQTAGQRILLQLGQTIPALVESAQQIKDDEIGQVAHMQAMASAWHEHQYSRLFRS